MTPRQRRISKLFIACIVWLIGFSLWNNGAMDFPDGPSHAATGLYYFLMLLGLIAIAVFQR